MVSSLGRVDCREEKTWIRLSRSFQLKARVESVTDEGIVMNCELVRFMCRSNSFLNYVWNVRVSHSVERYVTWY
jgi:hypothetical protein